MYNTPSRGPIRVRRDGTVCRGKEACGVARAKTIVERYFWRYRRGEGKVFGFMTGAYESLNRKVFRVL